MPRSSLPKPAQPSPAGPLAWFGLKRMFGRPAKPGAEPAGWPVHDKPSGPMPRVTDYDLRHVIARNERATIYQAT